LRGVEASRHVVASSVQRTGHDDALSRAHGEHRMCAMIALCLLACPDCPTARDARGMFWQLDLLRNAAFAVLPFIVTLAIAALIVRAVSTKGSGDGR
jgi:hypothetical protein